MNITKQMLDIELQKNYFLAKIMSTISTKKWIVRLGNKLTKSQRGKNIEGLDCAEEIISSRSGNGSIRVRIYKPQNSTAKELPAMLYIHGGGYMSGIPDLGGDVYKNFINNEPCIIVAPDYTKSLTAPFPAGFNDCYDTLLWLKENAKLLGARQDKFIVAGHSAGGGLTAAVVLKATDTQDVNIAFQMPIYPMIDDRLTSSSTNNNAPVWNSKTNKLGWDLYLKGLSEIPIYAAPARATDYSKLPPTITFVGSIEPFKDETITYVTNLKKENVVVKFKIFKGAFHAFDMFFGKNTTIGKQALKFTADSYKEFVQKYFHSD